MTKREQYNIFSFGVGREGVSICITLSESTPLRFVSAMVDCV